MRQATEGYTPNAPTPAPAREALAGPVWQAGFLAALGLTGNISQAARAVHITRQHAHRVRRADAAFAELWDEALQVATDALAEEARRLATGYHLSYKFDKQGTPLRHPVTGEPYAERLVHPGLLVALLKAHRPELFGDKLRLQAEPPAPAYDLGQLSADELTQLEALTRKALPRPVPDG